MDHLASAIIQQFNITKSAIKLIVVLWILVVTSTATAQKKDRLKSADLPNTDVQESINRYFFDGISQKNADNEVAAIRSFLKVTELDPLNDAAYFELGLLYTKQKNYAFAERSFSTSVELDEKNVWYLNSYAKALQNTGKYKESLKVYENLIKLEPDKIEVYFDIASVRIYLQDFKGAIKEYNFIEKKIGINEDVINQKQKIWLKLGKIDKAAAEAKRLINKEPNEIRYKMNLAEIYLANNKLDDAIEVLKEIAQQDPNNSFVQLALADYYREKKDDQKSYDYLKLAFANPSLNIDQKVRILSPFFSMLEDASMRSRALTLSELVVKAHPTEAKATAIYGDFLYQDKQLEKAKTAYEQTLVLDKKVFAVWQNLMFIQIDLSDFEALLKTSNEAVELFPAQQLVHYLNALAKSQTKDYEGAINAYKNALLLNIANRDIEAQIYAGLGDAYHNLIKHKESDESYDKALSIKPEEPYVLNNYAYYLSLRNVQLEKALSMSAKSNELLKDNSSFLDTYAWILFQLKRYTEAKEWILKAMNAGGSKSATIVEHYGDILFMLNDVESALRYWNEAAKITAPSELLKRKIQDKKYYE